MKPCIHGFMVAAKSDSP